MFIISLEHDKCSINFILLLKKWQLSQQGVLYLDSCLLILLFYLVSKSSPLPLTPKFITVFQEPFTEVKM